jgi:hypothetical protein
MCTVRNYRLYDCPPIGIVNCVKALGNWKKAFGVVLEELHIYMKAFLTQKIIDH